MAFRRTDKNIPQEVTFPETLAELGFTVNIRGHIVDKTIGEFFNFEKHENNRTNQQRYHAVHKAVRKELHRILTVFDIQTGYVWEDDENINVSRIKPESPSVCILSSSGFYPDEDKELYLIVGDSKNDLGILSRYAVLTEGGLSGGSVLGLITALRGKNMPDMIKASDVAKSSLPNVVVFNPGELLWSNKTQECMSKLSWNDQKRDDGFAGQYKVTDKHNQIRGHEDPESHVSSCLLAFLGDTVGPKTRIQIITMGDGSEHVLSFLNDVYAKEALKAKFDNLNINIAMAQPTHNDDDVTNPALKQFLAEHGRIWESHSLPKGTLLADVAREFRSLALPPTTQQADNKGLDSGENESESEYDYPDTPPGELSKRNEPIDFFRGPGLEMPLRRRAPVAEEPKADEEKGLGMQSVSGALATIQAEGQSSLCQRFSAGVEDTPDMILPKVMGDVLKFFEEKRA